MDHGQSKSLGDGFVDHGVASPISNHRGTVVTVDGDGRAVVLVWLFDHRGGYALLMIDAETGEADEVAAPFDPGGDCPFASILSSRNRYYTHFNSHFCEFDPAKRAFTFHHATVPQMAMSMTEDDAGRIWSATYPKSGLACYDPEDGSFVDYGHLHEQSWQQYQRTIAADDSGWVYFAIGNTLSQIIAFDPTAGTGRAMLEEAERVQGTAQVFRDENGKVYGQSAADCDDDWLEFDAGKVTRIGRRANRRDKVFNAGAQGLFHREFGDGRVLESCDLITRTLAVKSAGGETAEVQFDYTSDGAHLMGVAGAPDGTLCGGTMFPMRQFNYDPAGDAWRNRESYHQWNTVARGGDRFFVGAYPYGILLEWDPSRDWVRTEKESAESNPRFWIECNPVINRPHCLLVHPDGRTIVLAGTPDYGYTGGGLLFWDRETGAHALLGHTEVVADHSTMSLVALGGGKLLGGTTIAAGTGGAVKADEAVLYVMDMDSKEVEWSAAAVPGTAEYTDMAMAPEGLVYCIAAAERFVVFDAEARRVVHEADIKTGYGGTVYQQGPRKILVDDADGGVYLLLAKSIVRVDAGSYGLETVAEAPVEIQCGGDIVNGRIWFGSGSHLCSYGLRG